MDKMLKEFEIYQRENAGKYPTIFCSWKILKETFGELSFIQETALKHKLPLYKRDAVYCLRDECVKDYYFDNRLKEFRRV